MSEFGIKGNINDEDLMFHVLNNLPAEHGTILDSFENYLTSSGPDALMIDVI